MKEVGFRAWDKITKTMIPNIASLNCSVLLEDGTKWNFMEILSHPERFIVMQYTGFVPGLYEDDILLIHDTYCDYKGVVRYDERRGAFYLESVDIYGKDINPLLAMFVYRETKILGNVHEHPGKWEAIKEWELRKHTIV